MKLKSSRVSILAQAILLTGICATARADTPLLKVQTPKEATAQMVAAANTFLATLDEKQRSAVLFKFDDDKQRARWSNFPTGFIPRSGLKLGDLSAAQQSAAMALMASALSSRGYEKVQQIMDADEVLKSQPDNGPPRNGGQHDGGQPNGGPRDGGPPNGGQRGPRGGGPGFGSPRPGGGGQMFGKDLYYISFLGNPSETDPWMLQFGGHHLALNITIVGERGVLTPTLTGAQPAMYQLNGKTVRPLGQESDKGIALINSLDESQKKQAILNYRVADLVLGPDHDGETIQPEGLKVSTMNEKQQTMLLDLISEWAGIQNDSLAKVRMEEIKAGLTETWFAWSGPTTVEGGKNITAYYRIQGPKLVIEYSPQSLGGDLSLHVHTMYRDPTNDYGQGLVKK